MELRLRENIPSIRGECTKTLVLHQCSANRALGCAKTSVAYGSNVGTAFSEFTTNPWPCGVDITQITIRHGTVIDAVQIVYKTVDQHYITGARNGGGGGSVSVIRLEPGERITGVAGMVCNNTAGRVATLVHQLTFSSQKQDGQRAVYGPYGTPSPRSWRPSCRVFTVNGKINSIFGRLYTQPPSGFTSLGAIGFYYEDESRVSQNTN